jgi:hypothetical protein
MAKSAKITLRGSLSHTHRGRKFARGVPQIVTDASEIAYYKQQSGFSVKMLKEKKATKKTSSVKKIKKFAKPDLQTMKKPKLVKLAEKRALLLTGEETKKDLIEAILVDQQ